MNKIKKARPSKRKDGIIKFSFLGEGIADHPSIEEIIKLLESLEK